MRHRPLCLAELSTLPAAASLIAAVGWLLLALPNSSLPAGEVDGNAEDSDTLRRQPLSAAESLQMIEVLPGLKVELVVAEPDVVDPISAVFDARGRLWVVEMYDYPTGPPEGDSYNGKIKVLTDSNGDGQFDDVGVFADSLPFVTGIQPWGDGVIATLAGRVAYLADTTGDGVYDTDETWFTGFTEANEQLRANHPTWTLENEIHVANGLRGGDVQSADERWPQTEKPLSLNARDFRFSPFGGPWRTVAGNSQYGFFQDDRGRNFICSNRNPCDLLLADADQVATNPLIPLPQWRVHLMPSAADSEVFPLVDAWTTSNLHAGQFTAACGVYRYQSDLLAEWLEDDFFACEPTGSLVQRYRTVSEGIVPDAQRGRAGVEFLASHDPWFRAVKLFDGPDGAMYVIDMHRAVIEHPQFMPEELKQRGDMRWGDTAGRIYRIVPEQAEIERHEPVLADQDWRGWVESLSSGNRWRRVTASQLLAEWLLGETVPDDAAAAWQAIAALVQPDGDPRAVSRCLWLLDAGGQLRAEHLQAAVQHTDVGPRLQVVRLLPRHRDLLDHLPQLMRLASDPEPLVRYQWLLEFAPRAGAADLDALVAAASPQANDSDTDRQWIGRAVSLASDDVAADLLAQVLQVADGGRPTLLPLVKRLGWAGSVEALHVVLATPADEQPAGEVDQMLFNELADGMAVRARPWSELAATLPDQLKARLDRRIEADRQAVSDGSLSTAKRVAALRRVGLDRSDETLQLCLQLAESRSDALYTEAVGLLRRFGRDDVAPMLVDRIVELPPQAAKSTVTALVNHSRWTPALVDALASGEIPWGMIDPSSLGRLQRHRDKQIAERVKQLRSERNVEGRQELIQRYTKALNGPADPHKGQVTFVKQCAGCHRIDGEGVDVGPDISDMRTQTPEQILVSILDPNAAIDANYYRYAVVTGDGQLFEGLLEDSNEQSVTLRLQDNVRQTVPRDNVEHLRATGVSMMPEGFEEQIDPEAMRDLVTYLKRWRLLSSEIPLGRAN